MKIIQEKTKYHKYAFDYEFSMSKLEFCRYLKAKYGWQEFNFFEGKWRFNNPEIAKEIKYKYAEVEIDTSLMLDLEKQRIELAQKELTAQEAEEIKTKTSSDIKIDGLKLELYPYQKVGVEFFVNNNGRAILADEVGLGKSGQSIAYAVHTKKKKILIVCPASVKYSWESEVLKWTYLNPYVIYSKSKLDISIYNKHDVFIINYDILKTFFEFLSSVIFDCLIGDEIHFCKSNKAIRSKAMKLLASKIPSTLLLSGTPMLNRPDELFNILNMMDNKEWSNWYKYTERYCGGKMGNYGWEHKGATNIEELRSKMSRYFLRREKDEVLKELPPKVFIDVPLSLSSSKQKEYDIANDNFAEYLSSVKGMNTAEVNKSLQAEKLAQINALRQLTTMGKVDAAKEIIESIIDSGEKVVVFSCYNEPLEYLMNRFPDVSVMITGKTDSEDRGTAIKGFQENPNIKIFFGGMKSAGAGITLTAGRNVVFLDYSWVPADHEQAIGRIHRISQIASSVSIYQLYAKNTIDEEMKKLLDSKKDIFNKLIENNQDINTKNDSLINALLDSINRKYDENKIEKGACLFD